MLTAGKKLLTIRASLRCTRQRCTKFLPASSGVTQPYTVKVELSKESPKLPVLYTKKPEDRASPGSVNSFTTKYWTCMCRSRRPLFEARKKMKRSACVTEQPDCFNKQSFYMGGLLSLSAELMSSR